MPATRSCITGEGSDEILGGYAHFRRDMLLYNREGQDPAAIAALLDELEQAQPGLARPAAAARRRAGRSSTSSAVLGFVPSWIETFSARVGEDATTCSRRTSSQTFGSARQLSRAPERSRRARAAHRPRSGAPVALPLVQDAAADLHPDHARRSHGDGALDRRTRAVPRPPCRRGDPLAAGAARRSTA